MSASEFVERGGELVIQGGDKSITLQLEPPSVADYDRLWDELELIGSRQCSGYHYERARGLLAKMDPEDRKIAVKELMEKDTDRSHLINQALLHPDGCAYHIWMLSRKHHNNLTLAELRALVTKENVAELQHRVWEIVTPKKS
jgi:hypothetical protein